MRRSRKITVELAPEYVERLEAVARNNGVTVAEVIRQSLVMAERLRDEQASERRDEASRDLAKDADASAGAA